jgi:hypothetical protein
MQSRPSVIPHEAIDLTRYFLSDLLFSAGPEKVAICRYSGRDRVQLMRL